MGSSYIKKYNTEEIKPPKDMPVLVAGGIAKMKTGGEWFTGMEWPQYERKLQWEPKWWAPIPDNNDPPTKEGT